MFSPRVYSLRRKSTSANADALVAGPPTGLSLWRSSSLPFTLAKQHWCSAILNQTDEYLYCLCSIIGSFKLWSLSHDVGRISIFLSLGEAFLYIRSLSTHQWYRTFIIYMTGVCSWPQRDHVHQAVCLPKLTSNPTPLNVVNFINHFSSRNNQPFLVWMNSTLGYYLCWLTINLD